MNPVERRLHRLHDRFLYASVMLGFFAVVTGGASPIWLTLGFPAGLIAAHIFYRRGLAKESHNRWWNVLIVIALIYTGVEYLINPLAQVMVSAVRFALVLTLIKCFSRRGPRDELQIYALSFLTMAAASEINIELFYGLIFGVYVLTGTFSLAIFHLKTEATRQHTTNRRGRSPFDRFYISTLAAISLLIFASSIIIFFAFPRVGLGLFTDPSRGSFNIAGFSDEVEIGEHGTLRDNQAVVMRVDFDGAPPPNFSSHLWRVMSFDHYDGRSWSRTQRDTRAPAPYSHTRTYDLRLLYTPYLREHFDDDPRSVEIYLEPLGTSAIPTLWPTSRLQMGKADASPIFGYSRPGLEHDLYGDVHHDLPDDVALTYTIDVHPPPPTEELRRQSGQPLNSDEAEPYLQLPDGLHSDIADLADELTADADSHFAKAEAIGEYFTAEFEYTVELPEIRSDDPVAEFLFEHQEGHCEYFATAAAVLLRHADVPTRLVNGFLGGTYNEIGEFVTIRQGDAHAWVELYVPELGWVPFDPTPALQSSFLERSRLYQTLSDSFDAARLAWLTWVVDYDLERQLSLFSDIGRSFGPATSDSSDDDEASDSDEDAPVLPFRAIIFWGGWLLLVGLTLLRSRSHPDPLHWRFTFGIVVATFATAFWTGFFHGWAISWMALGALTALSAGLLPVYRRRSTTPDDLRAAQRLFRTIERSASRRDLARRPDEGPAQFLDRLGSATSADPAQIRAFRSLYLCARFGPQQLTDDELTRLHIAARALTEALRTHRPR